MPPLFEPLTLRGLTLKHRLVVSPMCMYSSEDGFANDWHLVHLGSRACGGAALVFTEATAVEPEGRISPQDLGLWKDEHIEFLKRITTFIKSQGQPAGNSALCTRVVYRASHRFLPQAGKRGIVPKEQGGWTPLAPSPVPFNPGDPAPEELTVEGIQRIVRKFREAAARALAAGFEVVELHAAHGYLMDEFLSTLANHRKDTYGGSFENRTRIVREVVSVIREVWPESKPLFMRISATDWKEPEGWTIEQSVELAKMVKPLGVDLIDCSSGGIAPDAKIPNAPGYQTPFAEKSARWCHSIATCASSVSSPRRRKQKKSSALAKRIWSSWPVNSCATRISRYTPPPNSIKISPGPSSTSGRRQNSTT